MSMLAAMQPRSPPVRGRYPTAYRTFGRGVVDDLDVRHVFRRLKREALQQNRRYREVASRDHALAGGPRGGIDLGEIVRAEAGCADDHMPTGRKRRQRMRLYGERLGIIDDDVGGHRQSLLQGRRHRNPDRRDARDRADVFSGPGAGDTGDQFKVRRVREGWDECLADSTRATGNDNTDGCR